MDLTKYKNCRAHKQWIFISNNEKPYKPCCWFRSEIAADSYEEYHDKLSKLDIEKNCEYCIKMEEQDGGDWSPRTLFESQTDPDTFVITASIDNVCNLKCITCDPINSTRIAIELEPKNDFEVARKKQYLQITNKSFAKVDFIKQSLLANKLDNVRIGFLGGEPLLNPKVFELLDWLAIQPRAKKRICIVITTNGAVFSNKLSSYLGKFRLIGLQFSIDGTGKRFEHLRFNSIEDNMNSNIDNYYLMDIPFSFNFTLSWMNMLNYADTYNWMQDKYPKLNTMMVTKLEQPVGYCIEILPKKLRRDILKSELNRFNKPINDIFEKAIDVYKQHVTTGGTDDFNMPALITGVTDLFELDIKRQADHYSIFKQEYDLLLQYMSPEQKELLTATILKYRNVL